MRKAISYFFVVIASIVPYLFTDFVLFLKDPPPWPDEAIFYDMARNFLGTGFYSIKIIGDVLPDFSNIGSLYGPLYFGLLGFWGRMFGADLEILRMLSVILGLLCLISFFLLLKLIFNKNYIAVLGCILLGINPNFGWATRVVRMEILLVLFFILSIYFYILYTRKQKLLLFIISSIFAALSFLIHPIGAIVPFTIAVNTLFFEKKVVSKLKLLFINIIVILLLFSYWIFLIKDRLGSFMGIMKILIGLENGPEPFLFFLIRHDFYYFILYLFYFSIFIASILIFKKTKDKNIFILITALIISFIIPLFTVKANYHTVYFQPFLIALLLVFFNFALKKGEILQIIGVIAIFGTILFYVNLNFFHNIGFILGTNHAYLRTGKTDLEDEKLTIFDSKYYDYYLFAKWIENYLPKNQKVTIFLNTTPDPYFYLSKNKNFKLIEALASQVPDKEYKNLLDQSDYALTYMLNQEYPRSYINKNMEKNIILEQKDGYIVNIVKLKPKDKRR